jgi:hypothetical protein
VTPFYRNQISADRARLAEMNARREGRAWSPGNSLMSRLATASAYDADAFRAFLETVMCLALPQEVFERPGLMDKIGQAAGQAASFPGPDRRHLMQLLA